MPEYREEPDGSVRKQCSQCKEWRRPEGFPLRQSSADGLESQCRKCYALRSAKWRSSIPLEKRRLHVGRAHQQRYRSGKAFLNIKD